MRRGKLKFLKWMSCKNDKLESFQIIIIMIIIIIIIGAYHGVLI